MFSYLHHWCANQISQRKGTDNSVIYVQCIRSLFVNVYATPQKAFYRSRMSIHRNKNPHCDCSCQEKQCSHVIENRTRDLTFKCKILPPLCCHCLFSFIEPLSFFHGVLSLQLPQVPPPSHCRRVIAST